MTRSSRCDLVTSKTFVDTIHQCELSIQAIGNRYRIAQENKKIEKAKEQHQGFQRGPPP